MPAEPKPLYGYVPVKSRKNLRQYLYHATKTDNLDSIRDFGIMRGLFKGIPGWRKDTDFIWMDTKSVPLRQWVKEYYPDWDWTIVRVNSDYLDLKKLYKKKLEGHLWYVYKEDIPREAIHIVG